MIAEGKPLKVNIEFSLQSPQGNFFIMSTEFDKYISDRSYDCTDHKNGIDFFMRPFKWPKIDVKKCQNLIFNVKNPSNLSKKNFC